MARGTALCGRATVGGGRPTSAAAPTRGASGRAVSITDSRETTDISGPHLIIGTLLLALCTHAWRPPDGGSHSYHLIGSVGPRSGRERDLEALPPALQRQDAGEQRQRREREPVAARPRRRHQDDGDLVARREAVAGGLA